MLSTSAAVRACSTKGFIMENDKLVRLEALRIASGLIGSNTADRLLEEAEKVLGFLNGRNSSRDQVDPPADKYFRENHVERA